MESAATLLQSGAREQLSWNLSVTWLRERVRELMHPQQHGQASAWLELCATLGARIRSIKNTLQSSGIGAHDLPLAMKSVWQQKNTYILRTFQFYH